jgi:uncharacterized protein (TIGR02246 family)
MSSKAAELVTQAKKWATRYGSFTQGEEGSVLTAPLRVHAAWDANDADALAQMFVDNGSLLMGDEQLTSRDDIRSYMGKAFAGGLKGSRVVENPVDIRVLAPDTALAITEGGLVMDGESELQAERVSRSMWILVKREGDWRVLCLQSSP